jgi:hypothetical protein
MIAAELYLSFRYRLLVLKVMNLGLKWILFHIRNLVSQTFFRKCFGYICAQKESAGEQDAENGLFFWQSMRV